MLRWLSSLFPHRHNHALPSRTVSSANRNSYTTIASPWIFHFPRTVAIRLIDGMGALCPDSLGLRTFGPGRAESSAAGMPGPVTKQNQPTRSRDQPASGLWILSLSFFIGHSYCSSHSKDSTNIQDSILLTITDFSPSCQND